MSLTNKPVLITGAVSGVGQGVALEMARRGAIVIIHFNRSIAGALLTKQFIQSEGGEAYLVQADAARQGEMEHMVEIIADRFGQLHTVVNHAADLPNEHFVQLDEPSNNESAAIHLQGYWACIQAVTPLMRQQRFGRIINISSSRVNRLAEFEAIYAASNDSFRFPGWENSRRPVPNEIAINIIEPGDPNAGKQTNPKRTMSKEMLRRDEWLLSKLRTESAGPSYDIARLACAIAEEENECLNGAAIRLDGKSLLT